MAKISSATRLLRSLARAARSRRSPATTLLSALLAAPSKPSRARKPRAAPAQPAAAPTAPGSWQPARHLLPPPPGQLAGRSMEYWLYLPKHRPDAAVERGLPLVVMLHGCHQDARQFAEGTRMNRLAEAKGYAVLYPQQSAGVQRQRCWRWYDRATQQGGGDTVALAALIDSVCGRHPIDRGRVYACGLSAGAGMAAVLALNHPELIAAIGLHSAPMFGAGHSAVGALQVMRHGAPLHASAAIDGVLQRRAEQALPMPPIPALLVQGEDDTVVRPVNQQQLARQWLQLHGLPDGAPAKVTLKPAGRGNSRNAYTLHDYLVGRKLLLRVASIAGLGHAWSGGDPAMKFHAAAGPEASRMMLDFFGRHRRQAAN